MRFAPIAILLLATFTFTAPAQTELDEWELIGRLCGKLVRIERIPGKRNPDLFSESILLLTGVQLRAYERVNNGLCCDASAIKAETLSNKSGEFDFKGLPTGKYWFTATVESRDYKLPVLIQQTRDKQPVCSEMSYVIEESGKLALRVRAPKR